MEHEEKAPRQRETSEQSASGRFGRVITAAVTVTMVIMAALVLIFSDRLGSTGLQELLGREPADGNAAVEPYSYENGTEQHFAVAGDGFAVVSRSGLQLSDSRGRCVVKEIVSLEAPAVAASDAGAVFFDVGGTLCKRADFDGQLTELETGGSIISAAITDSGCVAVISEESGSKGLVQVFDRQSQLLYRWYSGSGYPLRAQVSPDDRELAVLCLTENGSVLHLFRLDSEEKKASVSFPGELHFDLAWLSSRQLCVLGSEGLAFCQNDGSLLRDMDWGGAHLAAYDFGGSGFAAVYLSEYRAGAGGTLLTLDGDGTELGRTAVEGNLISLSARGRQVLFAASAGLTLYSQALQPIEASDELLTAKAALLRPRGDVLLLSSYAAEPFDF